jgi:hypothetical protein
MLGVIFVSHIFTTTQLFTVSLLTADDSFDQPAMVEEPDRARPPLHQTFGQTEMAFLSEETAGRTLQRDEIMNMLRKG